MHTILYYSLFQHPNVMEGLLAKRPHSLFHVVDLLFLVVDFFYYMGVPAL